MKKFILRLLKPAVVELVWAVVQKVNERTDKVTYDEVVAWVDSKL